MPTLAEAVATWRESRRDVSDGTRTLHQVALNRALPLLGSKPLDTITAADVDALVSELSAAGRKRATIAKTTRYLAAVLDKNGIDPNPAKGVRLPYEQRAEIWLFGSEDGSFAVVDVAVLGTIVLALEQGRSPFARSEFRDGAIVLDNATGFAFLPCMNPDGELGERRVRDAVVYLAGNDWLEIGTLDGRTTLGPGSRARKLDRGGNKPRRDVTPCRFEPGPPRVSRPVR